MSQYSSFPPTLISGVTIPGTVTVSNFPAVQAVSGPLTDAQLRASPVPISGAFSLPAGASTSALQVSGNASLTSIDSKLTSPLAVTGTFFQATQPVSLASLPLPSGASTSALQVTGNSSLSSIDSKLTSPLAVTGTFFQATQPVSGTVTANAGTGTFAVSGPLTDAELRATPVPVSGAVTANAGSGTFAVSGSFFQATQPVSAVSLPLPAGASTSALQTSGNASLTSIDSKLTSPLSVTGTFFQATQPVSGTVTANQGAPNTIANRWPVQGTDGTNSQSFTASGAAKVDGSAVTQPVSAVSLPLPTGASTSALQVSGNASLTSIDTKLTSPLSVTGTFFQATQPISAASLPLPTGAATSALQTTGNTSLSSIDTNLGSVIAADGSAVPAKTVMVSGTDGTNIQSLSVDTTGKLNINNISGVVSLPTGAATETSLVKLPLGQGSTTSGQSGVLDQGAVTTAAPTYTTGQTSPLSLTTLGRLRVSDHGSFTHLTGAATTTEKSGVGVLKTVVLNTRGAAGDTITIYDNTAGSGTVIAIMSPGTNGYGGITMHYNCNFTTGLTTVTTGTSDWTVVWQ